MKRFMQFFSFAAMTQLILLLNQVALLPMQIRIWGVSQAAMWYAAIAVATVTTVADLGLRTAGHVELLRLVQARSPEAEAEFQQIWAWIRALVLLVTVVVILADGAYGWWHGTGIWEVIRILLAVAYALETLLTVRIVYLDSLGEYSRAEASYFAFAAIRLAIAAPALLVFKVHAFGLSFLFLATSMLGLLMQGWLCTIPRELLLFRRFPSQLSFRACSLARYTMAEPCANWVRISLPVLVIAAVAPAAAVTTYVALRAIYGAARTTIQQMARVASVEVLRLRTLMQMDRAESLFAFFILFAGLIGTGVASVVVLDNLRLLSLWLRHFDRSLFQNVNLTLALTAPFYSYQVIVALSFRIGQLSFMARRQYAYVLYSAMFACAALITHELVVYLTLLVIAEMALSISFMVCQHIGGRAGFETKAGWRGLAGSGAGSFLVLVLWMIVRHSGSDFFLRTSVASAMQAGCVLCVALGLLLIVNLKANSGAARSLRNTIRPAAVVVSV
jgi:hypothetical protein